MRQLKPIDTPRAELSMCANPECVRPTDRVRMVQGHPLCLECHLDCLYFCAPDWRDPDFQTQVKYGDWRNSFKPTAAQVAKFIRSLSPVAESARATP